MDALLLDAKAFVGRLSAVAYFLHESSTQNGAQSQDDGSALRQKKLSTTLKILQATRGTVDDALDAHGAELEGRGSAAGVVSAACAKLENFKRKAAEAGLWEGVPPSALVPAASALEDDLSAIDELRAGPAGAHAHMEALEGAVRDLRALEAGADFQARLRIQSAALAEARGWSEGNFAYGSTLLRSWLAVWQCPALAGAAEAARCGRGGRCVVWGSSLGWLCFFTSLCFGVPSTGVEILPCLVAAAEAVRQARGAGLASFAQGDMLQSPLEGASVVVLASQCWDRALHRRAGDKLSAELAPGALVIDYTPALREWGAFGEPVWTCVAPTSWNPRQSFYVFAKKPGHG